MTLKPVPGKVGLKQAKVGRAPVQENLPRSSSLFGKEGKLDFKPVLLISPRTDSAPGGNPHPGSFPYPASLLAKDSGHTKYTYLLNQLGLLHSETKVLMKLLLTFTSER